MIKRIYKIGSTYSSSLKNSEGDQFKGWINIENSGMNDSGIRHLKYVNLSSLKNELPHTIYYSNRNTDKNQLSTSVVYLPAYVVLLTSHKSTSNHNPWDDYVNISDGEIIYWGDAKNCDRREFMDFYGNKVLNTINDYRLSGQREFIPPILHFSKHSSGRVTFNGLCVLEDLQIQSYYDHDQPIKNFRCKLCILDTHEVDVEWLHHRARIDDLKKLNDKEKTPEIWLNYIKKDVRRLNIYKSQIRKKEDQLPSNEQDMLILENLNNYSPTDFEKIIVALFRDITSITHKIEGTRAIKDGGFDFWGEFILPAPLNYHIRFLGEVKRYRQTNSIGPGQVSRLVARLGRDEFGIYITTSYYTEQAQQEVLQDRYPVKLFSGIDVVNLFKEAQLITDDHKINPQWLDSVLNLYKKDLNSFIQVLFV